MPFWEFIPVWQNIGNTRSVNTIWTTHLEMMSEPDEATFIGQNVRRTKGTIESRDIAESMTIVHPDAFLSLDVLYGIGITPGFPGVVSLRTVVREKPTVLWGWAVYNDAFSNTEVHLTEICRTITGITRLNPAGAVSIHYQDCTKQTEHNCVDRYCKDYEQVTKAATLTK